MFAIIKNDNPTREIFEKLGVSLDETNRRAQRVVLNPELLVEFESRGVTKNDLNELISLISKVSRIFYS